MATRKSFDALNEPDPPASTQTPPAASPPTLGKELFDMASETATAQAGAITSELRADADRALAAHAEAAPMAAAAQPSVAMMLQSAIERGLPVEALEKLVALHERMEDRRAAQEFADAMAKFQERMKSIPQKSKVRYTTKSGSQVTYSYADLNDIAETVRPILHELGISYNWDSDFDGKVVTATCTLRHTNGHSISSRCSVPVEASSIMNDAQRTNSARTYARRISLVEVLGLTSTEPDTDAVSVEKISAAQAADLRALMAEVGMEPARFLNYMQAETVEDILAVNYQAGILALEAKRRASR